MALGGHPMVDPSRQMMQPRADVPRSALSTKDFFKFTFGQGTLVPVFLQEILPGDSWSVKMSALVRLATPIVPVMDNIDLQSFFFFVPMRLLWDHWEKFIAGPAGPTDTTTYLVPQIPIVNADCAPGNLADYFGLTVNGSGNTINVTALPFRAFNLIWNEWFRDQALQDPSPVPTGDGPDAYASYGTQIVNKRHDYFTSARPWPQGFNNTQESGNIGPLAPGGRMTLGRTDPNFAGIGAPVHGLAFAVGAVPSAGPFAGVHESAGRSVTYGNAYRSSAVDFFADTGAGAGAGAYPLVKVLVNDIRTSFMIQAIAERQARVGGRYTEYLRGVWGIRPQDSRLQRPEYLGGGRTVVTVNPVAQTSASGATGTTTKLGQLAAAGYVAAHGHGFSQSFPEHGYVLGLMCTRSDLTYQQGVDRMWKRKSAFDFYRPELAHLGEQAVMSYEIYSDGSAGDDTVFGYQERWAEYRMRLSRTAGYMRSTVGTPIDMWHFGEKFTGRPTLNGTSFLLEAGPVDRVLQTTAPYTAQFMADVMFECRTARCLPMFSVPGLGARL